MLLTSMFLPPRWPTVAAATRRCIHSTSASWSRKASRRPLTGKMANKNYMKGKGVRPIGRHTKHGAPAPLRLPPFRTLPVSLESGSARAALAMC